MRTACELNYRQDQPLRLMVDSLDRYISGSCPIRSLYGVANLGHGNRKVERLFLDLFAMKLGAQASRESKLRGNNVLAEMNNSIGLVLPPVEGSR